MSQDELDVQQIKQVVLKQESIEQNIGDLKYQVQLINEQFAEDRKDRKETYDDIRRLTEATLHNAEAIGQLTAATAGVIEVYNASQGAIKVGSTIGKFVKWLSGFAVVGVAATWVWKHLGGPPVT
jgi:hypothetical protein